MKRSEALTPLSHDHHQALFVALKLKRADESSAAEARDAFLAFWKSEGRRHFHVEEEVLLPAWARHGPADHPAVVKLLTDHVDLRRRSYELGVQETPAPADLHELGERLEGHIRHEERVFFPLVEEKLPPADLERLARELASG